MRDQEEKNKRKERGNHQANHRKSPETSGTEETNRLQNKISVGGDDNIKLNYWQFIKLNYDTI